MERDVRLAAREMARQAVKTFGESLPPDLDQALRFYVGAESMSARAAKHALVVARRYGL